METILINAHSVLRYAVLLFGLYAITKAARGLFLKQEYTPNHRLSATLLVASVHLQIVIGLVLYFLRGWAANWSKMGEIMGSTYQRFWTMEHLVGMLLGAVLIQIGSSKSKRQSETAKKHKTALTFFVLGFLVIFLSIPWPFRGEIARALWP
jgi:hypothetical protein